MACVIRYFFQLGMGLLLLRGILAQNSCLITKKIDLAIIFDGSSSMAMGDAYTAVKTFMRDTIGLFDVQTDPLDGTRVAVWAYTTRNLLQYDFVTCRSRTHAMNAAFLLREIASTTALIPEMLNFIASDIFDSDTNGARYQDNTVERIALVILDSPVVTLDPTLTPGFIKTKLANAGIKVYMVVITNTGASKATMDSYLPTGSRRSFELDDASKLQDYKEVENALKADLACSPCYPTNPCQNSGTCTDTNGAAPFVCQCLQGWGGNTCETQDPCALCKQNGGKCNQLSATTANCDCSSDKVGEYCQLENRCAKLPDPCNGGNCTPGDNFVDQFSCTNCPNGFSGPTCTDPVTDVCTPNPCNNNPCIPQAGGTYTCDCPPGCSSATCLGCSKISNCGAFNPCKNNCFCQKSMTHEGGFYCYGTEGYLGRFCQIEKADIVCGADAVTVSIPQDAVREYESGVTGAISYMSPTSIKADDNCLAKYDQAKGVYVITVKPSVDPYSKCITSITTGGKVEFHGKVWLNRVSNIIDMAVPIVNFKCRYQDSFSLVSVALQPVIPANPPVINKIGKFNVTLEAFSDPPSVPNRAKLSSGAIYTVGETVYLTASLTDSSNNSPAPLVVKIVSCYATSVINTMQDKTDIVVNGCGVTLFEARLIGNAQSKSATVAFRTFKLNGSSYAFYTCKVDVCPSTDQACTNTPVCPANGRKRRSEDNQDENEENLLGVGPLLVLTDSEKKSLLSSMLDEGEVVYLSNEGIEERGSTLPSDGEDSTLTPLILVSVGNFVLLVALATLLVILYIRGK